MKLTFLPVNQKHAIAILNWRYPFPYDRYNFNPDNFREDLYNLLDDKNAFFAISNLRGELEGYCTFGSDGRVPGGRYNNEALDIGMGIRPDLVGHGRAKSYAMAVARYGVNQYQTKQLRVTIAEFNQRAQRVWKQLGFEQIERFIKIGTQEQFVIMTRAVSQSLPLEE